MSENVNVNHFQMKFIDSFLVSMEYQQVCFCSSNKKPIIKIFFWGGGGEGRGRWLRHCIHISQLINQSIYKQSLPSDHEYKSNGITWIFDLRPTRVSFYLKNSVSSVIPSPVSKFQENSQEMVALTKILFIF